MIALLAAYLPLTSAAQDGKSSWNFNAAKSGAIAAGFNNEVGECTLGDRSRRRYGGRATLRTTTSPATIRWRTTTESTKSKRVAAGKVSVKNIRRTIEPIQRLVLFLGQRGKLGKLRIIEQCAKLTGAQTLFSKCVDVRLPPSHYKSINNLLGSQRFTVDCLFLFFVPIAVRTHSTTDSLA